MIEESSRTKNTVRDLARLEKQRRLAETLRLKADAEERGEDVERQKNWEWTIEENEEWEKKLARKGRRADFEFHGAFFFSFLASSSPGCRSLLFALCFFSRGFVDDAHAARRKYKKEIDKLKPDLETYNRQKEAAMGLAPGTLSRNGSSEFSLMSFDPTQASSSQVTHFLSSTFDKHLIVWVLLVGPDCSPATGGSRKPLPGCEQLALCRQQAF